jgi:hypothetical protein
MMARSPHYASLRHNAPMPDSVVALVHPTAAGRRPVYKDKAELSIELRGLCCVVLGGSIIKIPKFRRFSKLNRQIKRKNLLIVNPTRRNGYLRWKNAARRP